MEVVKNHEKTAEELFQQKLNEYNTHFATESKTDQDSEIEINMRTIIEGIEKLTPQERRNIFDLHNEAICEEVYATKLMKYCSHLVKENKFRKEVQKLIYFLSIDWPYGFRL